MTAPIKTQLAALNQLASALETPVKLMEVCGTHTMAAFQSGLRPALPEKVQLISGPGCPVCVTPIAYVDHAIALARLPRVMIATFGDMIRVPGSQYALETARALGADVRVVYGPADALALAQSHPEKTVVFLGVGFETTVPAVAWTIKEAKQLDVPNFKVLCAHKTMPQAMAALLQDQTIGISGFVCPGHVSVIIGAESYRFLTRDFHIPAVVTGFEPADMVLGIEMLVKQILEHRADVEIEYARTVHFQGNQTALSLMDEVFEPCDAEWRGLGTIARSGLCIKRAYRSFDAAVHYQEVPLPDSHEPAGCLCGAVLRGVTTPPDCPLFKTQCTPRTPVGACMVSGEGTCAAYYKYGL